MSQRNKCCESKPVHRLTGGEKLCKKHFVDYFERKVKKTLTVYKLVGKKERVGVAVSGGKDSLSCLYLLNNIFRANRGVEVVGLTIDMGIRGYGDRQFKKVKKFCSKHDIRLYTFSLEEDSGITLDKAIKMLDDKPCTICGVLRRQLLNRKARELGLTRIATGHNLDDEAQSILMNQFRRNVRASARLGPVSGVKKASKFVPRIKPLYFCSEDETLLYARLTRITKKSEVCPRRKYAFRKDVANAVDKLESRYPGVKQNIVRSFLEILPLLKREYGHGELKYCKNCGEPTSREVCNNCLLMGKLASLAK